MTYFVTPPVQHSSSISATTLLSGYRTKADAAPAPPFPFMPYDQPASYSAYVTSQNGFPDPQFHLAEPSLAAGGSSSLFSTAQTVTPPVPRSTWDNGPSGNIGPSTSSPIPDPSESFAYGAQQSSEDSVRHAVLCCLVVTDIATLSVGCCGSRKSVYNFSAART